MTVHAGGAENGLWQYSPLAVFLVLGTFFLVAFTFYAWNRRHTPGLVPVLVLFAGAAIWSAASATTHANTRLSFSIVMEWLKYPVIVILPVAYLLFSLWYTEPENHPSSLFLLVLRYRTVGTLFRTQIMLVLTAGIIPILANVIFLLDLGPAL